MDVVWTRPALRDTVQIRDYIAADSPRYARVVTERLFAAVERLGEFPLSGRIVPELAETSLREVISPPYRIVYRVRTDLVEIPTVVHSARRFPADTLRTNL